jgi:hypothetical protein
MPPEIVAVHEYAGGRPDGEVGSTFTVPVAADPPVEVTVMSKVNGVPTSVWLGLAFVIAVVVLCLAAAPAVAAGAVPVHKVQVAAAAAVTGSTRAAAARR